MLQSSSNQLPVNQTKVRM